MEQGYDIREELPIRLNETLSSVKDWINALLQEHQMVHTTGYDDAIRVRNILGEEGYKYEMEEWEWGMNTRSSSIKATRNDNKRSSRLFPIRRLELPTSGNNLDEHFFRIFDDTTPLGHLPFPRIRRSKSGKYPPLRLGAVPLASAQLAGFREFALSVGKSQRTSLLSLDVSQSCDVGSSFDRETPPRVLRL